MVTATLAPLLPILPTPRPPRSILDVAQVVELPSLWQSYDTGMFESYNCGPINVIGEPCVAMTGNKQVYNPSWANAQQFALYRAIGCKTVGMDLANTQQYSEDAFNLMEGRGVEQAIPQVFVDDVTVIPATGLDLLCGFAALSDYAAANYAGPVSYVMSRLAGVLLSQRNLVASAAPGEFHVVATGEPVLANSGSGQPPGTDVWLYAFGATVIGRTPLVSSQQIDMATNDVIALAERAYVVAVDCNFIAGVQVPTGCT